MPALPESFIADIYGDLENFSSGMVLCGMHNPNIPPSKYYPTHIAPFTLFAAPTLDCPPSPELLNESGSLWGMRHRSTALGLVGLSRYYRYSEVPDYLREWVGSEGYMTPVTFRMTEFLADREARVISTPLVNPDNPSLAKLGLTPAITASDIQPQAPVEAICTLNVYPSSEYAAWAAETVAELILRRDVQSHTRYTKAISTAMNVIPIRMWSQKKSMLPVLLKLPSADELVHLVSDRT